MLWRFSVRVVLLSAIVLLTMSGNSLPADEGMWLFNNPPRQQLKERYGFEPTDEWLSHVQQSAVRFNSGGSGSFVSSTGLVMTNHHVGADALQKFSTADHDYIATGFHARSRDQEIKCVDLELNVLKNIEDVTARVNAAVKPGASSAEAEKARRAVMNTIEKESLDKTGMRSDVVTLYQGGEYHLYRYKKYTDVRLVFAPEKDIAFFGGDPDNFEYPRYDLDICFFRVYENGEPAKVEHYLKWSAAGADDGELIFVAGHPGKTSRLNTVAHLEFIRDKVLPTSLNVLRRREVLLKNFSDRSLENARRAQDDYFSYQNSRKARLSGLAGLQDPAIMNAKRKSEQALQDSLVASSGEERSVVGDVEKALARWKEIYAEYYLFETGQAFNSELFRIARTLVRLEAESKKPNSDRLREYRESNLESLKQELFSEAPIYDDFETVKLADSLGMLLEWLGTDHPLSRASLAGRSPKDRAAALVAGTKLKDVDRRKRFAEPTASGRTRRVGRSRDTMIELATLIDEPSRRVRKIYEEEVEEPLRQAYAKIAAARFKAMGTSTYPDATFTLRLAFGTVKGLEDGGRQIPPWTTMSGTFEHSKAHQEREPFKLPDTWLKRKDRLKLSTPMNFVSTADIIGGNSGSPVINRRGEVVGIIFDGNIQSLVLDFVYSDVQARAVSVHSAAIVESLRKIYDARELADELDIAKR